MYEPNMEPWNAEIDFGWNSKQSNQLDFEDPSLYSIGLEPMFGDVHDNHDNALNMQYYIPVNSMPSSGPPLLFASNATGFETPSTVPIDTSSQHFNTQESLGTNAPQYPGYGVLPAQRPTQAHERSITQASLQQRRHTPEIIGTVLFNEASQTTTFNCHLGNCKNHNKSTSARLPELKRHSGEQHALSKPSFWCSELGCPRSEGGKRPFRRMEKCAEHVKRFHSGVLG